MCIIFGHNHRLFEPTNGQQNHHHYHHNNGRHHPNGNPNGRGAEGSSTYLRLTFSHAKEHQTPTHADGASSSNIVPPSHPPSSVFPPSRFALLSSATLPSAILTLAAIGTGTDTGAGTGTVTVPLARDGDATTSAVAQPTAATATAAANDESSALAPQADDMIRVIPREAEAKDNADTQLASDK